MNTRTTPVSMPMSDGATDCIATVSTAMVCATSASRLWERLVFYEQIDEKPPLHLRVLLPVPIETVGRKSAIGDEARCLYEQGHLVKRVTQIDPGRHYAFEIVEQELAIGGNMKLSGGEYVIRELAPERAEITVATRYTSSRRPRWLWEPVERAVCHSFHRHILRAMRRGAEGR